jgi:hypothetical protein
MAVAAHRAGDRGAARNGQRLSEGGRSRRCVRPPGGWGLRAPAKPANEVTTGSDAGRVERTANPSTNPNPENLSTKEKAKAKSAKPANEVTTGFGVDWEAENAKRSVCELFREAIELGLSRGRDATAILQDMVSESGFGGGYQTVKRYVRKLRGKQPLQRHGGNGP